MPANSKAERDNLRHRLQLGRLVKSARFGNSRLSVSGSSRWIQSGGETNYSNSMVFDGFLK
jgi:hypothetical protein